MKPGLEGEPRLEGRFLVNYMQGVLVEIILPSQNGRHEATSWVLTVHAKESELAQCPSYNTAVNSSCHSRSAVGGA